MRIVIVGEDTSRASEFKELLADYGLEWEVAWQPAGSTVPPADSVVDVFVCGRMDGPGATGSLLAGVAASHPHAVRILLLDQASDDRGPDVAEGLDGAHRVLARPLDPAELVAAVESVVDLRALLDNETLKQAVGRISSLPPPPRLYLELSRLLRDPDASNASIAQALSQDPAIAAKVLRLCNSAYFSGGREISDMRTAVVRLGHQTLLRLVLASEAFGVPQFGSSAVREAMQERALRTSNLARRLLPGPSAELAATAALLAEVGRLLPGIAAEGSEGSAPHYAQVGAYLLGLWGLPMPIVEGVAFHHRPAQLRSTGFWVAGAVHVATTLVSGESPDQAYLQSVGLLDKLPQWREWVEPQQDVAA